MGNRVVRKILLVMAGSIFLFSTAMVLKYHLEMRAGAKYTETLIQAAVTPPSEQPGNEAAEKTSDETVDTVATVDAAPIQVDFDTLCAKNQDVIAWLYCPDTPINYPVVQASDNEYYLRRLLDGSRNPAGTLFMDYRNAADFSSWNSVIYGHNMTNDSMFGSLTDYKTQSYFDAHPEMYLLTPEQGYVIKVITGFTTPANSELYSAFSPNNEEKIRLMEGWLNGSDFASGIEPAAEDRLITLSTCSYEYDDARYVLIGILSELNNNER